MPDRDVTTKSRRLKPAARALAVGLAFTAFCTAPVAANAQDARTITFAEVLAAPDDPRLNLDYARQEVRSGRLQQAAAALERLLLARPNWDSVRLFYGVVLYRLADMEGAARELRILENRPLTPTQEADRVKYLTLATQAAKPLRITSRFSLGTRYDSNPNRVGDDVADLDDDADIGFTGSSRFRVEYDIATNPGDYIFFQSNGAVNFFSGSDQADFIGSRQKAGVVFNGATFIVSPYVHYGNSWLQNERFRSQWGAGVDSEFAVADSLTLLAKYRFAHEDYEETDFSSIGSQRDGDLHEVRAGVRWRPSDRQTFTATGLWADKDADFDGFSYQRRGARLRSLTLLGEGWYLDTSIAATRTDYETFDNFYTTAATGARDDTRVKARAAVGAPLSTLFSKTSFELPEAIGDIVLQVGVTHERQNSNVPSLDIRNTSGDIFLTKRFAF
ncbi:MAG: surface lipoprotein assembly modifier [Pseudomonadota bacterium]